MGFKHHTGNAKGAPTKGPDTALPVVIIIAAMIPFGRLKCRAQPFMIAIFRRQFSAVSVNNSLLSCQSNLVK
jgi:hypothetical protein